MRYKLLLFIMTSFAISLNAMEQMEEEVSTKRNGRGLFRSIYNVLRDKTTRESEIEGDRVEAVRIISGGRLLVTVKKERGGEKIIIYDLKNHDAGYLLLKSTIGLCSLLSNDETTFFRYDSGYEIKAYDTKDYTAESGKISVPYKVFSFCQFGANHICCGMEDGAVRAYDKGGNKLFEFKDYKDPVDSVLSINGDTIITASLSEIRCWKKSDTTTNSGRSKKNNNGWMKKAGYVFCPFSIFSGRDKQEIKAMEFGLNGKRLLVQFKKGEEEHLALFKLPELELIRTHKLGVSANMGTSHDKQFYLAQERYFHLKSPNASAKTIFIVNAKTGKLKKRYLIAGEGYDIANLPKFEVCPKKKFMIFYNPEGTFVKVPLIEKKDLAKNKKDLKKEKEDLKKNEKVVSRDVIEVFNLFDQEEID